MELTLANLEIKGEFIIRMLEDPLHGRFIGGLTPQPVGKGRNKTAGFENPLVMLPRT